MPRWRSAVGADDAPEDAWCSSAAGTRRRVFETLAHKVSSRRPAILRTRARLVESRGEECCRVRGLGPCGGSGPGPSPDFAFAHRLAWPGPAGAEATGPARRTGAAGIGGDQPATT